MNISREKTDELNSVISVVIEKNDYEERVGNTLKDYRRKARIDGFRPGKVPFGLVNKLYRKPVLVEEVNNILNETLTKYFVDEKLNILGEPLPNETRQKNFDWDHDTSFEFVIDVGLAPELDITVSPKDKFALYKIKIDEKIRDEYTEKYRARLGKFIEKDAAGNQSVIKADIIQVDNEGNAVDEGIRVEDASLSLQMIQDDKILKTLLGIKKDDEIQVNLKKAYPNNVDLASLLKVDINVVELINGEFILKIKSVTEFENAEVNQEFYDRLFGKDAVKSTEEYHDKLDQIIKSDFNHDAAYKFSIDVREFYVGKFKKDLPQEFLKRWLVQVNKDKFTPEQIEKDFNHFLEDLKWQLIKDKVSKENNLKVTEEELLEYAKNFTRIQFAQYYGISDFPEEHLANYANELLKKDEERRKMAERIFENKIIDFIKNTAKIEEKEISSEKFNKLLEK
ncbi:MAG: trigger factor [Bacteroidales bacterium]